MVKHPSRGLSSVKEESHVIGESAVLYKFNVLVSARVVCNIMVCKCEVESIGNCILENKFISKLI
jgi:hypothetical protein